MSAKYGQYDVTDDVLTPTQCTRKERMIAKKLVRLKTNYKPPTKTAFDACIMNHANKYTAHADIA